MPDDRLFRGTCWTSVIAPVGMSPRGRKLWTSVPAAPGVYAFYLGAHLVYIGSAVNLRRRIGYHGNSRRWCQGVRIKVAVTPQGWRVRERRLIERLRPVSNRAWNEQAVLGGRDRGCGTWAHWTKFGEQ